MKWYILILFTTLFFITFNGCSTKDSNSKPVVSSAATSIADSLMRITDSLRGKDFMHKNFYGIHKHGQDLAKHAHQNIPKKIRMRKKAASIKGKKIEAFNKENERRKKRIEEYRKKRGIADK